MKDFFEKNKKTLEDFIKLSSVPGMRPDYVQGGGGNTSCKFNEDLMAIKASGFRLSQISEKDAYAVLDYATVSAFYKENKPENFDDVEKIGSEIAKKSVRKIEGLPELRPSVEAGFHSLLEKYVLHTHPVYANFVACCCDGEEIASDILAESNYTYAFIPYINPGANLTFEIEKHRRRIIEETGKTPDVIFMQNHGFITTHDDVNECLKIHDHVNMIIAKHFGVDEKDFPEIKLVEKNGNLVSDTPWLKEKIKNTEYDTDFFCKDALYPDQLVFLNGNMDITDKAFAEDIPSPKNKCSVFRGSGDIVYNCSPGEARTIEETLCAVIFITQTIKAKGLEVITMSESGKDFIENWESEKHRKSIAEKS